MFPALGHFVARHWPGVIISWLALVLFVRWVAPPWDLVTHDGDLAFLPDRMPSVQGELLTKAAFPATQAKSELVVVLARSDRKLEPSDLQLADRLGARFHNRVGASVIARGWRLQPEGHSEAAKQAFESAIAILDEALKLDEEYAPAWHNRAIALAALQRTEEERQARETAFELDPELAATPSTLIPANATDIPLVEVWTRHHEVFGPKLRSENRQAVILVLKLANEFMATDNIRVLRMLEEELAAFQAAEMDPGDTGLEIGISGSAAVGGDMLRAAAESIRNTEWLTVILVVVILLVVYRAPMLVLVPVITIGVSLSIATGLLALLTQLNLVAGFSWWDFKVFKTTKIFIVVILYGSGTDFCLFLLARLREELPLAARVKDGVGAALGRVGGAISGSALTTVVGLGMMFFAEFGKFRNSGPAIGLCLLVTLAACLTLAPALMCAFSRFLFWPFTVRGATVRSTGADEKHWRDRFWDAVAQRLVRYPLRILVSTVVLLLPLAVTGFFTADHVTFDFLSELTPDRTTIRGNELLKQHFPVGEGGPVVVLVRREGAGFDSDNEERAAQAMAAVFRLTERLSQLPGVESVRSLAEPLGDPPRPISLISSAGRKKLFLREHRLTKELFLAQTPPYAGNTARFELVLSENPFSLAALETLTRIDAALTEAADLPDSFWHGAQFVYTGATAGIRDLRTVTRSDYGRIQLLVTLGVWALLVLILRRPVISMYLIASVLFSYFVTIGATELFFAWHYGDSFQGLDWKVPIFLFVILVAVGEDYNIYLVTRVFEEQDRLGPFSGLREAIARTGGIITSCGIIMAGSFVSMVPGSLRGISELGFALTLGILLDTFIVRTILVPSFLAVAARWQVAQARTPAERRQPVEDLEVSAK